MKKLEDGIEKVLPDEVIIRYIGKLLYLVNDCMKEIDVLPDKQRHKQIKDMALIIERLVRLKKLVLGSENINSISLKSELKDK